MAKDEVSFALKESVKDFAGGSVVVGEKVVNIGRRLKDGDGAISTSDPHEIAAFRGIDVLKEVPAKAGSKTPGGSAGEEK